MPLNFDLRDSKVRWQGETVGDTSARRGWIKVRDLVSSVMSQTGGVFDRGREDPSRAMTRYRRNPRCSNCALCLSIQRSRIDFLNFHRLPNLKAGIFSSWTYL